MPIYDYPYTNFHNLNLDWLLEKIKRGESAIASDELPLPDGTAEVGTSNLFARGDHVHPEKVVYVTDYGAVGDGVTDDTDAFQKAINTNKMVIVPDGDYVIQDIIVKTGLVGLGKTSNIILNGTISIPTQWRCTIANLIINTQAKPENTNSFAIYADVAYTTIHDVSIVGHGRGIHIGGASSRIYSCSIEIDTYGIEVHTGDLSVIISDCIVRAYQGKTDIYTGTGIVLDEHNIATTISNTSILLFDNSLIFNGQNFSTRVSNCFLDNAKHYAVWFRNGLVSDTVFENCWFSSQNLAFNLSFNVDGLICTSCVFWLWDIEAANCAVHISTGCLLVDGMFTNCAFCYKHPFFNQENARMYNCTISSCMFGRYRNWHYPIDTPVFTGDFSIEHGSNLNLVIGCNFYGRTSAIENPEGAGITITSCVAVPE